MSTATAEVIVLPPPIPEAGRPAGLTTDVTTDGTADGLEEHLAGGVDALGALKVEDRRRRRHFWVTLLVLGGVAAAVAALTNEPWAIGGAIAAVLVGWIIAGSRLSNSTGRLHAAFAAWRERGVPLVMPSAIVRADACLRSEVFDASGVNSRFYNRYSGSAYVEIDGIQGSNLLVQHQYQQTYSTWETYTDSQGRTQSRMVQRQRTVVDLVFSGILISAPAPLPHPGWVTVRAKAAGVPRGLAPISVADPGLQAGFALGASDPFVGHRVLTPTLMEAIGRHARRFRFTPIYSYRHGRLYLAIPGHSFFLGAGPGAWKEVTEERLREVMSACFETLRWLQASCAGLHPN